MVMSRNGLAVTVAGGGTISYALGLKESLQQDPILYVIIASPELCMHETL